MERSRKKQDGRRPGACQPIGDVLSRLMARRGYARLQAAAELEQCWTQACGPLATSCRCGHVRQGRLEVIVENSVVLQELTFRKAELVERLQQLAPHHGVRDLRLRIGAIR